jgi:Holliday junction resolvasome RuvABC DNA-binding subunit
MRDRVKDLTHEPGAVASEGANPESEAMGALLGLGYKAGEAARLLKAVEPGTYTTEELIRRALQSAARD